MVGYQEITCHMVFDVNMDVTINARFVEVDHKTDPPESVTYASVVSGDIFREELDVEKLSADINYA